MTIHENNHCCNFCDHVLELNFRDMEWLRTAFAIPGISRTHGRRYISIIPSLRYGCKLQYMLLGETASNLLTLGTLKICKIVQNPKYWNCCPFPRANFNCQLTERESTCNICWKPTFEVPSGAFYIVMLHNWHTVSPDSKWQTHQIHSKWQCLITL